MLDILDNYAERIGPILDALEHLYVDRQQETSLLDEATALKISRDDAERHLLLLCRRRGIEVERLLDADFRLCIRAALGDRFLDEGERELLVERQGLRLFASAPDPREVVERIVADETASAGALFSERELRQRLVQRLAGRRTLSRQGWTAIQDEVTRMAVAAGVDTQENDLGLVYDQVRNRLGITLWNGLVPLMMFVWTAVAAALTYLGFWLAFS